MRKWRKEINMNINKTSVMTMIIAALVIIGMTGFAAATTVSIGDGTGAVTIPIVIEDVTDLGSFNLKLDFNSSMVTVTEVVPGSMDNIVVNDENILDGWIRIVGYQGTTDVLTGDITVANVIFAPVDPCAIGSCDLVIDVTTLKDSTQSGNSIERGVENGVYTLFATKGDVDNNGVVDAADITYLAKHVAEFVDYQVVCENVADVDGVSGVDAADITYLAMHVAEFSEYENLL